MSRLRLNIFYTSLFKPAGMPLLFSSVVLLIHLFFAHNYELHRDEYLYIALGQHLDWGYASVPPFIGFVSWLVSVSGLPVEFGLKLMAALGGALTCFLTMRISVNLGGKTWAMILAGTAYVFSVAYNRTSWLFMPVVFDILFWTLAIYFFVELIRKQNPVNWLPLGLFCGLGLLNKYTMAFLIAGIFFALMVNSNRRLIFSKLFIIGTLLGLLVFLPNLYWQIAHDFPVIRHMMQLKENQLDNVNHIDFIINQFLMNLHAVPVWLTGLIGVLFIKKAPLSNTVASRPNPASLASAKALRAVSWVFCFTVVLFMIGKGKAYYTLGLYPVLFSAGGYLIGNHAPLFLKWLLLVCMLALSIPLLPMGLPFFKHDRMIAYSKKVISIGGENFLKWEDGRVHDLPQDYADMTGWKELAAIVEGAYNSLSPEEKLNAMIYCENYGYAGSVAFYANKRLPDPISFNDNFLLWAPDSITAQTMIYVNDEIAEISTHFEEVVEFGRIKNPYARETGLPVYICRKPIDIHVFYAGKVKELKRTRF